MFDEHKFKKIDTEEKAYWLGFLDADGCIHNGKNYDYGIELGLQEQDYNHLVKFKDFIGKDNKICYREKINSYRYQFKNKTMNQDLINLGCIPHKSLILKFPNEDQVPDNLLIPFIRGYFDGDGSFWFKNKIGMNILSSKDFLNGLKNRIKLFKDCSLYPVHYENLNGAYRIQTGDKEKIDFFLDLIYKDANIYLDRKYKKYLEYKKIVLTPSIKVI